MKNKKNLTASNHAMVQNAMKEKQNAFNDMLIALKLIRKRLNSDKFDGGNVYDLQSACDEAIRRAEKNIPAGALKPDVDYLETFFEMTAHLMHTVDTRGSIARLTQESQGRGGLYTLAQQWTDEFQAKFAGREWDGEWWDEVDNFVNEKEANNKL